MDSRRRIGVLLVALGVLLLLGRSGAGFAWPLFVLVPGAALLAAALAGPRSNAGLAVPGAIVTTVGLVLLAQQATGRFDTWSYAWGLVLAAVGLGTFLQGAIQGRGDRQREGLRLATLGLGLFAAFGVFFEFLVFGERLGGAGGWVLPLALVLGGAWMLRRGARS